MRAEKDMRKKRIDLVCIIAEILMFFLFGFIEWVINGKAFKAVLLMAMLAFLIILDVYNYRTQKIEEKTIGVIHTGITVIGSAMLFLLP